jgi:hypothetical protein
MPHHAAPPPTERRVSPILRDGRARGVDVRARTAPVEIVPHRMVNRMLMPPVRVGCHGDQAAKPPQPLICSSAAEERAVAAIMLNDEDPHDQSGSRNGQRQTAPRTDVQHPVHRRDQAEKEKESGRHLAQTAAKQRRLMRQEDCAESALVRVRIGRRGWDCPDFGGIGDDRSWRTAGSPGIPALMRSLAGPRERFDPQCLDTPFHVTEIALYHALGKLPEPEVAQRFF